MGKSKNKMSTITFPFDLVSPPLLFETTNEKDLNSEYLLKMCTQLLKAKTKNENGL